MKVGDLVTWHNPTAPVNLPSGNNPEENMGIILDKREGYSGEEKTTSYQIAWFQAKEIYWHNEENLDLYSEAHN